MSKKGMRVERENLGSTLSNEEDFEVEEEMPETIRVEEDPSSSLVKTYITNKPQERTELNKGEVRAFTILYSVSGYCNWPLLHSMCEEYYRHMRSYKRQGIKEDISLISNFIAQEMQSEEAQAVKEME